MSKQVSTYLRLTIFPKEVFRPIFQFFKIIIFQSFNLLIFQFSIAQNSLDELNYHYTSNTNQLNYISDNVNSTSSSIDLENQSANNYEYNLNGQLTKDELEGIVEIEWTSSGKVKQISLDDNIDGTADRTLQYKYDAFDNRVKKIETTISTSTINTTYYIRNAAGELISIYEDDGSSIVRSQTEIISGSDHIEASLNTNSIYSREIGYKNYEFKDHLGSVRVVASDIKNPISSGSTFNSAIEHAADYYSFGMLMPARDDNSNSYRKGFQGMEKENDIKDNSNSYTTFFREYDPRVGRWNSLDPKLNYESPYAAMANNPIMNIDPLGDTSVVFTLQPDKKTFWGYNKTTDTNYELQVTYATRTGLANTDKPGLDIQVINQDGSIYATYAFNDSRDAFNRAKPNGDPLSTIETLIIDGEAVVDQQLKDVPDNLGYFETWQYTYKESMGGGALDFAFLINDNSHLGVIGGIAYNDYDFGNFTWGAAMRKLGWSEDMTWAGSNFNAWYNEKVQNGFAYEFQGGNVTIWGHELPITNNSVNPDRLTWRSEDCLSCFDEKYDQQAINNGYLWYYGKYEFLKWPPW